jgi:hypothetical protein
VDSTAAATVTITLLSASGMGYLYARYRQAVADLRSAVEKARILRRLVPVLGFRTAMIAAFLAIFLYVRAR